MRNVGSKAVFAFLLRGPDDNNQILAFQAAVEFLESLLNDTQASSELLTKVASFKNKVYEKSCLINEQNIREAIFAEGFASYLY